MADSLELDWLVTRMNPHSYRKKTHLVAVAAAFALIISGCDSHSPTPAAASATAESAPAPAPATAPVSTPASTSVVTAPDIKTFTTTGPLVAEQQADISAERDGRVVEIDVQIGQYVKAGQLLARLDDRILRSACDAQKARIASAQAEVRNWQAEQESAKADMHRADALRDAKILSDENWEVSKYKLDETTAQVARYQSDQAAAEADLDSATLRLDQSRIVAPFAGVIGRSTARPDQQVTAGTVLFWITAQSRLQVLFTVPETLMGSFSSGKPLDLTTLDYPGLHQPGRILRVSPVVDPASGSVQVIGAVDHPSPLLKPGMTMQVRLAP
jgi:membrane fusion protein (multidrug efflux system)